MQVLLWIFFILLLIVAVLLFVPIFYRVEGKVGDENELYAQVSWFFKLLRVVYDKDLVIKVGPKQINFKPEKEKEKPSKKETPFKFPFKFLGPKSLLTNLDIKSIISLGIILVRKLIKKVAPRHLYVNGVVGLDDPCATGHFIGLYEAVAYACGVRHDVNLSGDFSQKILKLDLKMSGRFAIASVLGPVIWFVLQKPVREGIRKGSKGSKERKENK